MQRECKRPREYPASPRRYIISNLVFKLTSSNARVVQKCHVAVLVLCGGLSWGVDSGGRSSGCWGSVGTPAAVPRVPVAAGRDCASAAAGRVLVRVREVVRETSSRLVFGSAYCLKKKTYFLLPRI